MPRIGIPTPTSIDLVYNDLYWSTYAEAVARSGGSPVEIPLTHDDPSRSAELTTCAGFILPGSPADVDPARYGKSCQGAAAPDSLRENTDSAIPNHAHLQDVPVLGICYGMQSINVHYGGTLIQDIAKGTVDHSAGPSVPVAHAVDVEQGSELESICAPTSPETSGPRSLFVNSSHHQAIDTVGKNLRITAWSTEDRIPEAIELNGTNPASQHRLVLAVQWHPERSFQASPESRALFRRLVLNAAQHQSGSPSRKRRSATTDASR